MGKGDVDLHQITTKPISQQKPNPTLKKQKQPIPIQ